MAPCSVRWCSALASKDGFCSVHASRGKAFRLDEAPAVVQKPAECDECGGTGDCENCYGDGTHHCGHDGCHQEHDCETCDGTGACRRCSKPKLDKPLTFDERYIAWAFDVGLKAHPPIYETPWESQEAA